MTRDGDTVTTTEPEWDDTERDMMLALALWEEQLCPVCGHPAEECQSAEAERRFRGAPPTRCYRTDAVLRYQEGQGTYLRPRALMWHAETT